MEEASPSSVVASKSLQELAIEGQRALEATVEAAHETLASMNEVLCNAALWSTPSSASPSSATNTTTTAPVSSSSGPATHSSGTAQLAGADPSEPASKPGAEGFSQQEAGWGALDEARLRLCSSATSLKAVIAAVFSSPQIKAQEDGLYDKSDSEELEKLEQRVAVLREEVKNKNKTVKLLIDQLRDLINDISMWQSPVL